MEEVKKEENPNQSNDEIIQRVKTALKEDPNSLNLMKKGDYSVHVLIEEIKNLISIKKDHLPKPMIKITCFGQTKRTSKPKNDCDAYTFNEHIYFDAAFLNSLASVRTCFLSSSNSWWLFFEAALISSWISCCTFL